jgi:lipid II:glycine glycyltransferase (peptidoglycan interpeptide bridge formation enzyme)
VAFLGGYREKRVEGPDKKGSNSPEGLRMKELSPGFTVEIDNVDKEKWSGIIQRFRDANIYQTWSYDAVRFGSSNISHLVLKKDENIVAVAQARIVKVPIIKVGVAYIRWGPIWHLDSEPRDKEVFRQTARALYNEYARKRGLALRLFPVLFGGESDEYIRLMEEEGFTWSPDVRQERTLILDLEPPLSELRKGQKQKWRNCLNQAEKNGLQIIEGHGDGLFEVFIKIYNELLDRKEFLTTTDIAEFRLIQRDLPDEFKMKIMICVDDGKPCAGAICSAIGNTGIYLFGATNKLGMGNKGSYLLQWRIIDWLKNHGCRWYDLHGINPEKNPGTYRFKAGLCGKDGKDVNFLGIFDARRNNLSTFAFSLRDFMKLNTVKVRDIMWDRWFPVRRSTSGKNDM